MTLSGFNATVGSLICTLAEEYMKGLITLAEEYMIGLITLAEGYMIGLITYHVCF